MQARTQPVGWRPHLGFVLASLAVIGWHLTLLFYFFPPQVAFGDIPMSGGDFATHLAQTRRVLEGLEGWGETWVYDPRLIAGHPAGTIFDADNKGWELWTWGAMQLGMGFTPAFKSFVLAAHLGVLPVLFGSARLFGLTRGAALLATFLGTMAWYFDSFAHWCWWAGMTEYAFAGYLALLPLALFWRFLESLRPGWAVACALGLGAALVVHPYTFIMLVVPMVALWIWRFRELTPRDHGLVLGIAVVAAGMSWWWLAPAFRFWHYILDSAYFGQSGLSFLAYDLLGILQNAETTGFLGTRVGFRFLYLAAGAVAAVRWWKTGDPRGRLFLVAGGTLLALTYLGGHIDAVQQVQPYRFTLPLTFLATIPAAVFFMDAASFVRSGGLPPRGRVLVAILLIPAGQHLVRDMLYFLNDLVPPVARLSNGGDSGVAPSGYEPHVSFRHRPVGLEQQTIRWIEAHDDGTGRWLVELPPLGEELAWQTDVQVLGGFTHRNLQHSWSNWFRRRPQGVDDDQVLRRFFETYAVKWLVISYEDSWFLRVDHPLLEKVEVVAGHHVFRVRQEVNLVARGGGTVSAETNRLRVEGSHPDQEVVLRYHWMETLECRPDCELGRSPVDELDPVGFISVPAPHPADFEIVNTYRFP